MRILEINTEKTWRGGERQTCYDCTGLLHEGHEVELLCRAGYPLEEKAAAHGIKIHTVEGAGQAISFLRKHAENFDVLHAQTAKAQFYGVITRPWHKRPLVFTRRLDFRPKGFLTRLKYRRTDAVVAISPAIRKILENFGVKNVALISESVVARQLDRERAKNYVKKLGFEGKKIVATTSAFVPHKDPYTLVRALKELKNQRTDFVFLHFGSGPLFDDTCAMARSLELEHFYCAPGFVDGVEDFFSVFDVFVMSSEEEGLGSSVLDAFIYKVPVASTVAGGLGDIVPGRGLTSPVADAAALAANIHRLLDDAALRNELTEKAFRYTVENHSVEIIARQYTRLFERLTGK